MNHCSMAQVVSATSSQAAADAVSDEESSADDGEGDENEA